MGVSKCMYDSLLRIKEILSSIHKHVLTLSYINPLTTKIVSMMNIMQSIYIQEEDTYDSITSTLMNIKQTQEDIHKLLYQLQHKKN